MANGPTGRTRSTSIRCRKHEAIARVNAAGYFVLTLNGDIYKIESGGGVIVQKREGFTNLFACRQARHVTVI